MQTDEVEQQASELFMNALKLCDFDLLVDTDEFTYLTRPGLIYHHLGILHTSSYCRTNNKQRKKQLLYLCRFYYEKSIKIFDKIDASSECLAVQIDRIDLEKILFDGKFILIISNYFIVTWIK